MAFERLFIKVERKLGGIELDGVITETHSNSVKLTSNPVELGVSSTDHAIVEPKQLSLDVVVSDYPLRFNPIQTIADSIQGFTTHVTSSLNTRSNIKYAGIVQLMERREKFSVQTGLVEYDNMLITGLSVIRDKDSSSIARMLIDLQEIIEVRSEVRELTDDELTNVKTRGQAKPTEDTGNKSEQPVSEEDAGSLLKQARDFVGGTVSDAIKFGSGLLQ